MSTPIKRRDERGFALLIVFLMAAAVALLMYAQVPRVAFESQRDKEQVLMDRGNQYKRAIQLYVAAVKKYPGKIEDLENTNDKRYLRKRYVDPMTGKDEWRLIHVSSAGMLTIRWSRSLLLPTENPRLRTASLRLARMHRLLEPEHRVLRGWRLRTECPARQMELRALPLM